MTTGRINQVAHNRIVLKQHAQIRKSFWQLFRKITAIRKLQLEHVTHLTTSNLLHCPVSSAVSKFPRELHHTWTHFCINSETKSQKGYGCPEKVPSHTLLITREKKKPPENGRFLITRAYETKKKTNGHFEAKNAIGGQLKKNKSRRERRIRNPHTQTPNTSQVQIITQPKLEGRKPKKPDLNRTLQIEPRRFNR